MEDPIFVCEVAQSLVNQKSASKKGGRKSVKEKQKILTDVWSNLLEVSDIGQRLKGALSLYFCCFPAKTIQKSLFLTFIRAENIALKFRTKTLINFLQEE